MTRPSLVVLDLAGTTVRDDGQVPAAFRATLAACGVALEDAELTALRGSSKMEAIRRKLPAGADLDARAAKAFEAFRARLAALYEESGVAEVAGAASAMRALRAAGIRVALNTGFDRDTTNLLLGALRWDAGLVDAVVTGDDVAHGRPAPDLILRAMELTGVASAADVANAGDTVLDLRAGAAAGVGWNVGVLSGAHGREILEREPHTVLLGSAAELPVLFGL